MQDVYDAALYESFGYQTLKPLQKQIIKGVLEDKRDVLAILATGYGKSICYQLPFVILEQTKSIIVVSPLIALMEDQSSALENKNIPVICMNSNMGTRVKEYEKDQILDKKQNKIIYMTPEYLVNCEDFITDLWNSDLLAFVAIDESHCVSSWGSDFRPEYKALGCLKRWLPSLNIMALTATATSRVRSDISSCLGLSNPLEFISSFDRPNLFIECGTKTSDIKFDLEPVIKSTQLDLNQRYPYGNPTYGIVYVRTREMTEKVAKVLRELGCTVGVYHAGLDLSTRKTTQQSFSLGQIKWIVATVAFGMGIDQNVNFVIHYGSPGDMESYYQEIGRAGRDGSRSTCRLFYEKDDMVINRVLLKDIKDPAYKRHRESQIRQMEKFLKSDICRRATILSYFGEVWNYSTNCSMCDNCVRVQKSTEHIQSEIQYPIYLLLKFIIESKINSGFKKIASILMGKKDATTKQFQTSKFFGLGKNFTMDFWKHIANICVYNDFLQEQTIPSGFGTVFKFTAKTVEWYNSTKQILQTHKVKSDDYERVVFILDDIKKTFKIPRDSLEIQNLIKTRNISGIEEILEEF
jgi:Werner syndrome ATP-dependent helicase